MCARESAFGAARSCVSWSIMRRTRSTPLQRRSCRASPQQNAKLPTQWPEIRIPSRFVSSALGFEVNASQVDASTFPCEGSCGSDLCVVESALEHVYLHACQRDRHGRARRRSMRARDSRFGLWISREVHPSTSSGHGTQAFVSSALTGSLWRMRSKEYVLGLAGETCTYAREPGPRAQIAKHVWLSLSWRARSMGGRLCIAIVRRPSED